MTSPACHKYSGRVCNWAGNNSESFRRRVLERDGESCWLVGVPFRHLSSLTSPHPHSYDAHGGGAVQLFSISSPQCSYECRGRNISFAPTIASCDYIASWRPFISSDLESCHWAAPVGIAVIEQTRADRAALAINFEWACQLWLLLLMWHVRRTHLRIAMATMSIGP